MGAQRLAGRGTLYKNYGDEIFLPFSFLAETAHTVLKGTQVIFWITSEYINVWCLGVNFFYNFYNK